MKNTNNRQPQRARTGNRQLKDYSKRMVQTSLPAIIKDGIARKTANKLIAGLGAILIIGTVIFFGPLGQNEYPQLEVYSGPLHFSGQKAYEHLETLVTKYPNRQIGTKNATGSAEWIAAQFQEFGLKTHLEEFHSFGINSNMAQLDGSGFRFSTFCPNDLAEKHTGVNVIGISPGKTQKKIIIGAHRDIIGTVQGAEDNGSGTVTMLELARVLSSEQHYYTYVFVSFDGEEVGLLGSANYVSRQSRQNKNEIALAVSLDMTGFKNANSIGFYEYSSSQGSAPLWTLALGKSVLEAQGLPATYFGHQVLDNATQGNTHNGQAAIAKASWVTAFLKTAFERISGQWSTDSGPFIAQNTPAVGVRVVGVNAQKPRFTQAPIHTQHDTIDQVSPKTLEMAGRFVEQYVKTLGPDMIDSRLNLDSRYFTHLGSTYLSPWIFYGSMLISLVTVMQVPAISLVSLGHKRRRGLYSLFRLERNRLMGIPAISLLAAAVWQCYRFESLHTASFWIPALLWVVLIFGGTLAIRIIRGKTVKKNVKGEEMEHNSEVQTTASNILLGGQSHGFSIQQVMLDLLLGLSFVLEALFFNIFIALASVAIPMFALNRLNGLRHNRKWVSIIALIIWTLFYVMLQTFILAPYGFTLGSIRIFLAMFIGQALWMYMIIYAH